MERKHRGVPTEPQLYRHAALPRRLGGAFFCKPLNACLGQNVAQVSSESILSVHNGVATVVDKFEYPLFINFSYFEVFVIYPKSVRLYLYFILFFTCWRGCKY
ncbi:hypothetical protein V8E55_003180 [Tylopilus felleus]